MCFEFLKPITKENKDPAPLIIKGALISFDTFYRTHSSISKYTSKFLSVMKMTIANFLVRWAHWLQVSPFHHFRLTNNFSAQQHWVSVVRDVLIFLVICYTELKSDWHWWIWKIFVLKTVSINKIDIKWRSTVSWLPIKIPSRIKDTRFSFVWFFRVCFLQELQYKDHWLIL